jgi:hypothetical protein
MYPASRSAERGGYERWRGMLGYTAVGLSRCAWQRRWAAGPLRGKVNEPLAVVCSGKAARREKPVPLPRTNAGGAPPLPALGELPASAITEPRERNEPMNASRRRTPGLHRRRGPGWQDCFGKEVRAHEESKPVAGRATRDAPGSAAMNHSVESLATAPSDCPTVLDRSRARPPPASARHLLATCPEQRERLRSSPVVGGSTPVPLSHK